MCKSGDFSVPQHHALLFSLPNSPVSQDSLYTFMITHIVRFLSSIALLFSSLLHANPGAIEWSSPLLQDHPLVGKIYDTRSEQFVSFGHLMSELTQASYILIGEKHDNPDHHRIEQMLVTRLLAGQQRSLVLEMLSSDQPDQPERFRPEPHSDDQQLKNLVAWESKSWPWDHYAPLIRQAGNHNTTVVPGNISKQMMMQVYRNGLATQQSRRLASGHQIPNTIVEKLRQQVFEEHCEMIPATQTQPMAEIQLARDAAMAFAMTVSEPSILIAGAYHVLRNQGTPMHLDIVAPDHERKILIMAEVTASLTAPGSHSLVEEADFLWFTPRFTNRNYCEDLKSTSHRSEK